MISEQAIDAINRIADQQKESQEEFNIPSSNISFTKAVKKLINLTPKALDSFLFRLVEALPFIHLQTLTRYVKYREDNPKKEDILLK